jgi:hypothetical protein
VVNFEQRRGKTRMAFRPPTVARRLLPLPDMRGVLVVLSVVVAGRAVAAEDPRPAPTPAPSWAPLGPGDPAAERPAEPGLVLGQAAAGMGTAFGGLMLVAAASSAGGVVALPVLMGTPALVGLMVCAVGSESAHYRAPCGPVIAAAFVGALSAAPLALVGMRLDHHDGEELSGLGGLMAGALVGWVIVQPLVATAAWRIFKQPRQRSFAFAPPRSFVAGPRTSLGAVSGQLAVPVLAAPF